MLSMSQFFIPYYKGLFSYHECSFNTHTQAHTCTPSLTTYSESEGALKKKNLSVVFSALRKLVFLLIEFLCFSFSSFQELYMGVFYVSDKEMGENSLKYSFD